MVCNYHALLTNTDQLRVENSAQKPLGSLPLGINQGSLTEGEGSLQLTSSLRKLVLQK